MWTKLPTILAVVVLLVPQMSAAPVNPVVAFQSTTGATSAILTIALFLVLHAVPSLVTHQSDWGSKSTKRPCPSCHRRCKQSHFSTHVRLCCDKYGCGFCGKVYDTAFAAQEHHRMKHVERPYVVNGVSKFLTNRPVLALAAAASIPSATAFNPVSTLLLAEKAYYLAKKFPLIYGFVNHRFENRFEQNAETLEWIQGRPVFTCVREAFCAIENHFNGPFRTPFQSHCDHDFERCGIEIGEGAFGPLPSMWNYVGLPGVVSGTTPHMIKCMMRKSYSRGLEIAYKSGVFHSRHPSLTFIDDPGYDYVVEAKDNHATAFWKGYPATRVGPEPNLWMVHLIETAAMVACAVVFYHLYQWMKPRFGWWSAVLAGCIMSTLSMLVNTAVVARVLALGPSGGHPTEIWLMFMVAGVFVAWLVISSLHAWITPLILTATEMAIGSFVNRKKRIPMLENHHYDYNMPNLPAYPTKNVSDKSATTNPDGSIVLVKSKKKKAVPDNRPQAFLESFLALHGLHHVTPSDPCLPCIQATCCQHNQTVIYPGIVLDKRAQSHLAKRQNFIIVPKNSQVHVNCTTSNGVASTRPLIQHSDLTNCRGYKYDLPEECAFDVYTIMSTPEPVPKPKDYPMKSVGRSRFIFDEHLVTMVYPSLETIPRSILTNVSARLVTDRSDISTLYDYVRTFFISKTMAKNIEVSDNVPWIILLQDLVNRQSMEVTSSLRMNITMGATPWERIKYFIFYYAQRYDPSRSLPSNTDWDFAHHPVPAYEVHHPRVRVNPADPRRPERNQPFRNGSSDVDATYHSKSERNTSTDGSECDDFHGEESSSQTTDTESDHQRDIARAQEDNKLLSQPTPRPVLSYSTAAAPVRDGVGRSNVLSDPRGRQPLSDIVSGFDGSRKTSTTTCADAELSVVPVTYPGSSRYSAGEGWVVFLRSTTTDYAVSLTACYGCARRDLQRYAETDAGSARLSLAAKYCGQHANNPCKISAGGLPSTIACAYAAARIREDDDKREASFSLAEDSVRPVGLSVPSGTTSVTVSCNGSREFDRLADEEGWSSEMFSEEGDEYDSDRPQKHQPKVRQFPSSYGAGSEFNRASFARRPLPGKRSKPTPKRQ